jgi:UDP-N-acetylmuramate dehydrogenase
MTVWDDLVATGRVERDVPLARHTTYKLGGPATLFARVDDVSDLVVLAEALAAHPVPVLIVGRGSNLLIADAGFGGLVVTLGSPFGWTRVGEMVEAGGSVPLPRLAREASAAGRGGLEWCVGVPGSVGGAVRQNAGCFGSEVVDRLVDVEIVSLVGGEHRRVQARDLDLTYRHSDVEAHDVVVAARFSATDVDPVAASDRMREITRWRRDHQPGGTLNAGSVFKNPSHAAAGAIIDRIGLKGFAVGSVRVSPRHANFIEAEGGATAGDVRRLVDTVRELVEDATGIRLEPEIQFVGFGDG